MEKDKASDALSSVLFCAFRELFGRYETSALDYIKENMKPFASWKKHLIVVVSYPNPRNEGC
jgi:hypothetical protein